MRRFGLVLVAAGLLVGVGHLVWVLRFSGVEVLDVALEGPAWSSPLPFPMRTTRTVKSHRVGPVQLAPEGGPYRAVLTLWGSGLRTEYGVAVLDARGEVVWQKQGARKKSQTPSHSTSSLGSFRVPAAGPHTVVVALTERPGIAPSGAGFAIRGQVAEIRWPFVAGCAAALAVGLGLAGRGGPSAPRAGDASA